MLNEESWSSLHGGIRQKYAEAIRVPPGTPVDSDGEWTLGKVNDDWEEHCRSPEHGFIEEKYNIAVKQLIETKERYKYYLNTGIADFEFFRSIQNIAKFDFVYRTGNLHHGIEQTDDMVSKELQQLFSALDERKFKNHKALFLNPDLSDAISSVGKADADIFLQNAIVEIKTTAKNSINKKLMHQLVGYLILVQQDKQARYSAAMDIQEIGVYFSRHADLVLFPVRDIIDSEGLERLSNYLVNLVLRP